MTYTRRLWLTFWPAALAAGAFAALLILRSDHDDAPWVTGALVLVAGWSFIAAGLVAWSRRPENNVGRLMVAVGFTLFLAALTESNAPWLFSIGLPLGSLFLAVFIHLLLAYPAGSLRTVPERVIVAAAYPVALLANLTLALVKATPNPDCKDCPPNRLLVGDSDLAYNVLTPVWDLAGAAFAVAVIVILYRRWRAATEAARRVLAPVFLSGSVTMVLLAIGFALEPVLTTAGNVAHLLSLLAFISVPYFFLAGLARTRLARADVGRLFADIPENPTADEVHSAFAHALHDPSVLVLNWLPERESYVDLDGRPVELGPNDSRTWTLVEYEGRRVGAIVHDPSLLEQPELLEAAVATARIGLEKDRLATELRARLVELERERDFVRTVVDASPALFLVTDLHGRIVRFNTTMEKLTGVVDDDSVRGRPFWEVFLPPEQADAAWVALGEPGPRRKSTFRGADGEPRTVDWWVTPLVDAQGKPILLVTGTDVTVRERQQEALRANEARSRALAEAIPDNVFRVSPEGMIVDFHAHDQTIIELPPNEVIGSTVWQHGRRENVERVMEGIRAALATGELQTLEYTHEPYEREVRILPSGVGDVFVIVRDITQRKRQEEQLRTSEARGRALLEAIPDNMFRIRRDLTYLDFYANTPEMLLMPRESIVGSKVGDQPGIPRWLVQRVAAAVERALETGQLQTIEYHIADTDREARFVPSGADEVFMIVRDVTEQRRQQAALRESEQRHRTLLETIPDIVFRLHRDGTVLDAHAHEASVLTTGMKGMPGMNLWEETPREAVARIRTGVEEALHSGELRTVEYDTGSAIREARILPSGPDEVVMISRDVTDRVEAEDELRRSRARIVEAADAERRRLERNLHDGAQQRLVSLSLALRLAQGQLGRDPQAAEQMLIDAQRELSDALADLRELARGIHPAILTDRGLGPAVEALAARAPLPVELAAVPDERLPGPVEAAAYYVVAEGLTNVVKYAQATSVRVSIERVDGIARVEVSDDGVGGADPTGGTGLRGLADRIESLAGRLAVESEPGGGTRLRAEIPV